MAVSRKAIRQKLAEILTTACTQASEIKAYQPSTLGPTPGIYVRSVSAERPPLTVRGKFTRFVFDILIVVLQSDGNSWTPDKAEDLTDDLEYAVCQALTANRVVASVWDSINYAAPSVVEHYLEDGIPYIIEAVKVSVEVARDA